jgi:class 3 adenylate cyclase
LDAVKSSLDDALSGRARLVMIVGEPGIGKTRLAEELGVYASLRGAQVCWGHCYEGELGVPYLPFVEALRAYVRDRSDEELRSELGSGAPEVAALVSDLRQRLPDLPALTPLDPEAERLRLFEGVTMFLRQASAARPLVLLLDDLHWADKPSLLLLQYLARNLRRDRVLLVATYRDVELDRTHPLADTVAVLRREQLYERILLRGLERAEVKALIEAVGNQETPEIFAETIHRETEGNPFFVAEILRHLAESGAISRIDGQWTGTAEGVAQELPEGVREVIGRRLTRLSRDCNRMLTAGAAMPNGFPLEIVQRVLDLDEDHALDLLDEALDAQVVRERRGLVSNYEFTHALIRQTLYSELSTPRRIRLHRQILEALEAYWHGATSGHLSELAFHAFQAAPGGDVEKAVTYATQAAEMAASAAAHEEAARSYDLALQALELDPSADERRRAALLVVFGAAARRAGDDDPSREALVEAAAIGRRIDDPNLFASAAYNYASMRMTVSTVDSVLTELCDATLSYGDRVDAPLRARVLAAYGLHFTFLDAPRHAALAAEAVETARRSGDPGALARALSAQHFVVTDGTPVNSRESYFEIAELAEAAGDIALQQSNQSGLCSNALYVGDREVFDADFARLEQLAVESRSPIVSYSAGMHRLQIAALEGRYEDADAIALEIRAIAHRIGDPVNIQNVGAARFPILRERGHLLDVEAPTRRLVESVPEVAAWRAGLALIYLESGRPDEAAMHLDVVAKDDFAAIGMDVVRTFTLALFGEIAAVLGERTIGAGLYELLIPSAGCASLIGGGVAYHGAVDRYLGLLATMLGRHDDAVAHQEAALAFEQRLRAHAWVARSRFDLGCALVARGAPGDRERAVHLLNEALDAANEIGMTRLVEQTLEAKLSLQGIVSSAVTESIDAVAAAVSLERPSLRQHAASDGTVTVLFSDIERYTELNERLGDARTQTLLREHDRLVRDAVAAHGGTVVKSQGDGFMVVFSNAKDALVSACEMQRSIAGHDFGADAGEVRVRIGTHSGEVIREGDDFFGRTVILAARVAGVAGGGEILVSDALRNAVGGAAGDTFGEAREVTLKGLTGTHSVHPLVWERSHTS